MKAAFMLGDIVELRSGGLPMTVVGHNAQGVNCQWQDAEGRPQDAIWNAVALQISEKSSKLGTAITTVAAA
jgi:uncharacterized protein YodC (DUF2158 family)